eukprot:6059721-Prymnesium_polylepis.1
MAPILRRLLCSAYLPRCAEPTRCVRRRIRLTSSPTRRSTTSSRLTRGRASRRAAVACAVRMRGQNARSECAVKNA